jgi:hypothetical protein
LIDPARIETVQTTVHLTTFVTRSKPSDAALKTSGKGFEFDFKVHPNEIGVQSGLQFAALLDGKLTPEISFEVYRQGSGKSFKTVKSDRAGLVDLAFEQAGIYVVRGVKAPLEKIRDGRIVTAIYANWLIIEVAP